MKLIQMLEILQKYHIDEDYPIWAEHDIIGFNVDYELISKEDLRVLEILGVHLDKDYNSLIMFV